MVRGVALGDAWGDPIEFASIASIIKDNPQGPDIPAKLRITDDTQMTLYLADALDESWDAPMEEVKAAITKAYLLYYDDPDNNRAPGITVMSSLGRLKRSGDWKQATDDYSEGSGTVMRTSPCAFLPEDRWVGVTAFAAAVTHASPGGVASAILNVAVLRDILAGKVAVGNLLWHAHALADSALTGVSDLTEVGEWLDGFEVDLVKGFESLVTLIEQALAKLPELRGDPWASDADPSMAVPEPSGAGWKGGGWRAPYTLVIALLAADMLPGDPMGALRRSVATDGDSDTIGAVTGALLGMCYPDVFIKAWDAGLRDQFEPRYVAWIENEADDYEWAEVSVARQARLRKFFRNLPAYPKYGSIR